MPERNLTVAAAKGSIVGEGWRLRKDGTRFWAAVAITALRDEAGQLIGFSKITRDRTEQKQVVEALRRSESLLGAVLDALPVGVWISDANGVIVRGNPTGHQIWSGAHYVDIETHGEFKGWWVNTEEPIAPEDWAATRAIINGETSINEEIEIECFDKTHKIILNSSIPIRDEQQNIVGAVMVNQDITELKGIETKLRRSAEALERNNRELEMFAYMASHDLQEPLRKIQAFGERLHMLGGSSLNEQGQDYLRRMINAANRMQNLIQDLLAYSRVTTMTQPFAPVNLNKVAQSVCSDLEIAIGDAHAQIEVAPLGTVDADETQMRQLFQNLISNAVKFHAQDRTPIIRISGRTLDAAQNGLERNNSKLKQYEIVVADNGIGFEDQYAERIFRMFQRLHGRSEYEGTGIGLAICQKIAERHHGTIVAHGIPGEGATFVITLPIYQAETEGKTI